MKNPWGWDGFTTEDLARCRLAARLNALFYDWWNIFVRLADPNLHREAITSRPMFLSAIAMRTRHARQTTLRVTSSHAKAKAYRPRARSRGGVLARPDGKCGAVGQAGNMARYPLPSLPGLPQWPPDTSAAKTRTLLTQPKRANPKPASRAKTQTAGFRLKFRAA
jgi:hypothetical protein